MQQQPGKDGTGKPSRTKRRHPWLRRLGFVLLGLLGLLVAVLIGGYAYLSSKAGGERLRQLVVENAGKSLAGKLEVGSVEYRGNRIILRDVKLRDPEGELVAEIARVEVAVALRQLLHKELDVSEAIVDTPRLYLKQDERGLNLSRAVASKKPKPEEAKKDEGGGMEIAVDSLALNDGFIDFEQSSGDAERTVRLEGLAGKGAFRMGGKDDALEANLALDSKLTEPTSGPFALRLKAKGRGDKRSAEVSLEAAGASLAAKADLDGDTKANVKLDAVRVDPKTARAFLPSYPLTATATLSGTVVRDGDGVTAHLLAKAADATAKLDGAFDLAKKRSPGVTLAVRGVDLSQLVEKGPKSDVQLDLEADGGGTSAADLDAHVKMTVPPSTMDGYPFGPVRLRASAHDGTFEFAELFAQLPGVKMNAKGHGTQERLSLQGHVAATDLSALAQTLGKLAGPEGLPLSGSGTLDFSVDGPLKHPGVALNGAFPSLRYEDNAVTELSLSAKVPDVREPLDAQARLDAKAISAGDKRFNRVHLALEHQGRGLRLDAQAHGYAELALALQGTEDEDHQGLRLSALRLSYPEATWTLQGPAHVAFGGGRLLAEDFVLRSGTQSIALDGEKQGERVRAQVALTAIDLSRLPKAFVDPELNLGGQLTARARVEGTPARPSLSAKVDLKNGRFKKYSNLALSMDGAYEKDRATGKLSADGAGVKMTADFSVPVKALKTRRRDPLYVRAHVDELRIAEVLDVLGMEQPLTGTAWAELHVDGTAADPRLELRVNGGAVQYRQLPPTDLGFALSSGADGKLSAHLEMNLRDKRSRVELRTPFTVAELLRSPPKQEALLRAPLEFDADVRELPLPLLYTAGLMQREVLGTLSLQAQARGTALAPVGEVRAVLDGLATKELAKPVDVVVNLTSAGSGVRADLYARQDGRPVMAGRAEVAAPAAKLRDVRALARAPLSLDATLGPVAIADLQALTAPQDVPGPKPQPVAGTLTAHLTGEGTLMDPKLRMRSSMDGLCSQGTSVGTVTLAYDYSDAKHVLEVLMRSANGGQLRLSGNTRLDISYPALTRGKLDVDHAPLSAELTSQNLELSFLSGVTPKLRAVGGQLQAMARAGGTLGTPSVNGDIEWNQGVLSLLGYGDYNDIHLKLTGSRDRIELSDLSAKSGDGKAVLSALAQRANDRFDFSMKADMNKFPLINGDQLVANVTLRADADGALTPKALRIRELRIPEAHIVLPDVKRKNLQKLDEAKDVVLVRNGVPLNPPKDESGVGGSGNSESSGRAIVVQKVNAPRNLWLKGNDVNTEVGLSDDFRIEVREETRIFGQVKVIRGRVDVFGRRFDLQNDSFVRFTGPVMKPNLDVTAKHVNEREQVTVTLHVLGEPGALQLTPTSDPPLTETEILTLIATGRRDLRRGGSQSSPSGQAASLVGSVVAGQLKKTLSNKLPLDVLSIEAGDEGLQGTKLEAGTYINDKLYIGFTGRIGADPMKGENANAVRLEYQLSKRWSLEAEYGDARSGSADLIWSKEY